MVQVVRIEVQVAEVRFLTGADDFSAESPCKASFIIDPVLMLREIGYDELRDADFAEDLIANVSVVMNLLHADRRIRTVLFDCWFNTQEIGLIESLIE